MFTHLVLFRIEKKHVRTYQADCRMWEREARRHPGFLGYHTLASVDKPSQYASLYFWKSELHSRRFMAKNHDRLVALSRCPVEVLDYFNFKTI